MDGLEDWMQADQPHLSSNPKRTGYFGYSNCILTRNAIGECLLRRPCYVVIAFTIGGTGPKETVSSDSARLNFLK